MRKVFLIGFMTLDGRGEFPVYPGYDDSGPDAESNFSDMWSNNYDSIDSIILGRRAYEDWAAHWPISKSKPDEPKSIVDFRSFLDPIQKIVISNSLTHADWKNTRIMKGDLEDIVGQLRSEGGKNIALGGGPLIAQAFMQKGLIDEYYLTVFPVLFGQGKPYFGNLLNQQTLTLVEIKRYRYGEVFMHYSTVRNK